MRPLLPVQNLLILVIILQLTKWILAVGGPRLGPLLPIIAFVISLVIIKCIVILGIV